VTESREILNPHGWNLSGLQFNGAQNGGKLHVAALDVAYFPTMLIAVANGDGNSCMLSSGECHAFCTAFVLWLWLGMVGVVVKVS
jgi:hypothetical protein